MEEKKEVVENDKISYEELNNVAIQLSQQNQQLRAALQEANMVNMFKRLDYLFKVIENSEKFDSVFVSKCITEIKSIMTLPEHTEE